MSSCLNDYVFLSEKHVFMSKKIMSSCLKNYVSPSDKQVVQSK